MKAYIFYNNGFYAGEAEDYGRLPGNATHVAPPAKPWPHKWPKFVDGAWRLVEDHRERPANIFGEDLAQAATDYWMPDDTWQSTARHMSEPGPLPEGASLTRPARPEDDLLAEAKDNKMEEVTKGYEAAMAASLTMPMQEPSATDVAVGAALFASDDAEGLECVAQVHSERRNELMALVLGAETREEVENIKVAYAV